MKGKEFLFALLMGIVIPGLFFVVADKLMLLKEPLPQEGSSATEPFVPNMQPSIKIDYMIPVLQADGTISNMELEQYLVGVLLGEMPMSFDIEALKAQAVVARTYTLRRCTVAPKHNGGAVCVNSACCQSYCTKETYLSDGGSEASLNKAYSAVSATAGQVITYNGGLIEATYFSCSGGRTEDALAVWGADIPYLQAVDSPGEENALHYTDSVSFSGTEFANRLGLRLTGNPASWFGPVTYTSGRGVATIVIGGVTFKGTELRQKLGIRSTSFTITPTGDSVHIVTRGFGHRVGMSQYGAEAMAVGGSNYEAILAHYYPGTSLTVYNRN